MPVIPEPRPPTVDELVALDFTGVPIGHVYPGAHDALVRFIQAALSRDTNPSLVVLAIDAAAAVRLDFDVLDYLRGPR